MTHGSLFDGCGGMRLGLEQSGFITSWTQELMLGEDITKTDFRNFARVECLSGGPPCQETSAAASFSGRKTNKSLWKEMLRSIKELDCPKWVIVEQPASVDKTWVIGVTQDLEQLGYGVAGRIIDSQHWVPQQRNRWFIVGRLEINGVDLWNYLYPVCQRLEGLGEMLSVNKFLGNCADCLRGGVFARVSARSLALLGAGNAVTTPVARWLGSRIIEAEEIIKCQEEQLRGLSIIKEDMRGAIQAIEDWTMEEAILRGRQD